MIIGIAHLISVLTSVSLSAATNLKVKGGGDYYLISRTLGLEFGGAIGIALFLAQAVSIAFYCIGFGEALARSASPSFRPTFKWFDQRLSLLGFLACLGTMLAIDPTMAVVAISILFAIFQCLRRTAEPARWADSRRAHNLQRVQENLLEATTSPEHRRDSRPQILPFTDDPQRRAARLRLVGWPEGGSGLTTVVTFMEGKDLLLSKKSVFSRLDFLALAEVGVELGVFEKHESDIISNLLKFNSIRAKDVMTSCVIGEGGPQGAVHIRNLSKKNT